MPEKKEICFESKINSETMLTATVLVEGEGANVLAGWKVFNDWLSNFDLTKLEIIRIEVQSFDLVGNNKVLFAKFKVFYRAKLTGEEGISIVFMRPDSVSILMVIYCPDNKETYILLTQQSRLPVGTWVLTEIPAGTMDKADGPVGRAIAEIEEETSVVILRKDLIELGKYYPSPGGCPELITAYLVHKELPLDIIKQVEQKMRGATDEGEVIKVIFVPVADFLDMIADGTIKDGKALSAVALILVQHPDLKLSPVDSIKSFRKQS